MLAFQNAINVATMLIHRMAAMCAGIGLGFIGPGGARGKGVSHFVTLHLLPSRASSLRRAACQATRGVRIAFERAGGLGRVMIACLWSGRKECFNLTGHKLTH